MYNPYDFYFKKAKKEGYKARSAFKLDLRYMMCSMKLVTIFNSSIEKILN